MPALCTAHPLDDRHSRSCRPTAAHARTLGGPGIVLRRRESARLGVQRGAVDVVDKIVWTGISSAVLDAMHAEGRRSVRAHRSYVSTAVATPNRKGLNANAADDA